MIMEDFYMDAEELFCDDPLTIAQKQEKKARKHRTKKAWLLAILTMILVAGYYFLAVPIGFDLPFFRQTASLENGWNLILVNEDYYIPSGFQDELVTLSNGQKVDRRIYPDLQEMFDTMRSQGVYPIVASGYRTDTKQQQLLDDKIAEYENMGYSWWKARKTALEWVAKPGTSEHQLGIAVDINQEGTRSTAQQVYDWLNDNAHLYGFIYRYPADKIAITGIGNEPWHYRYVGKEAAKEIYEKGICLEEYLESLNYQ